MTRQTTAPIERHSLQASSRSAREIARIFSEGDGDLSPSTSAAPCGPKPSASA